MLGEYERRIKRDEEEQYLENQMWQANKLVEFYLSCNLLRQSLSALIYKFTETKTRTDFQNLILELVEKGGSKKFFDMFDQSDFYDITNEKTWKDYRGHIIFRLSQYRSA